MFNDEIYNNGSRPYLNFNEIVGLKIVPFIATHVKMKKKFHGAMKKKFQPIRTCQFALKTTDIKSLTNDMILNFKYDQTDKLSLIRQKAQWENNKMLFLLCFQKVSFLGSLEQGMW